MLAFVGSGFARKGLDTVLAAMARSRLRSRLVVVGRDRELPRFAALAQALKIAGRVSFAGGVDDVRPHYAAADALVLPTLYDPFPNVVLEAMAMGLPAIVSDQCGAAELVKHGESGWIVPAQDAEVLAKHSSARGPPAARAHGRRGARRGRAVHDRCNGGAAARALPELSARND